MSVCTAFSGLVCRRQLMLTCSKVPDGGSSWQNSQQCVCNVHRTGYFLNLLWNLHAQPGLWDPGQVGSKNPMHGYGCLGFLAGEFRNARLPKLSDEVGANAFLPLKCCCRACCQVLRESLVHDAVVTALHVLEVEQRHCEGPGVSPYRYSELARDGLGVACAVTGACVQIACQGEDLSIKC
jgi:hypothetical protein